ncbi:hypothetical protein G7054_g12434 [Neopestalotiopsis clavispora]|nr:hypothetical protein G7054_g12434 [Neopestalotiopsis clavispora]
MLALLPVQFHEQPTNDVPQTHSEAIPSALSSVVQDDFRQLGYGDKAKGTPGVIRTMDDSASFQTQPRNGPAPSQWAGIIRELPSRRHIDILVRDFFNNVAWHYDIVDEVTFTGQLSKWSSLTHSQLRQGPDAIPASLRSFPALLFQILAQALLFQPTQYDESLNDLKYAADMELSDRAAEYSDAGHRLASSFCKSDLTTTIVQAELMRACFEKTTGAVIEAWHTLGVAIRDAQELGLHLIEPEPTGYSRAQWSLDRELRRNLWLILHLWDAHMATVLGRPIATRMNPSDVPLPMSSRRNHSVPGLPTPRDVILCGYHTAYKYLQDVHDLEKVKDWHVSVETIHETIMTNIANLPAWASALRSRQGEPVWLSMALEEMCTNVQFVVFALHRPFVFAHPDSRHRALQAATRILESQARLFEQTPPLQYKAFSWVFSTFDSMVLIAAMHIRFSNDLRDQFSVTKRNMEWGLHRLNCLQAQKNHLASSAFNIIQRLYQRMLVAVNPTQTPDSSYQSAESGNFPTTEPEMAPVSWDNILQLDLGDVLPPQPLNELLHSGGYFHEFESMDSVDQSGYRPHRFGSDLAVESLASDLVTDHSGAEISDLAM